jgi:hypothetical protein
MGMSDGAVNDEGEPLSPEQAAAAAAYRVASGSVPREVMWQAIQARRATGADGVSQTPAVTEVPVIVQHTTRGRSARPLRWFAATAVAAGVALSVTVMRKRVSTETPIVAASAPKGNDVAWDIASTEHFGIAESMLTTFSRSPEQRGAAQLSAWSRDLLESTRLLMDSPAGRDPKRRALLQDLELVLVQLVESGPALATEDRSMIDEMLSRSALLLTRIRTTVPAGVPARQ